MRFETTKRLALAMGVAAILFSYVVGVGQAQTVIRTPSELSNAERILNLKVDEGPGLGTSLWNVVFRGSTTAADVYGTFPGSFPFPSEDGAGDAVDAINAQGQRA
jgi:hypothetical protein